MQVLIRVAGFPLATGGGGGTCIARSRLGIPWGVGMWPGEDRGQGYSAIKSTFQWIHFFPEMTGDEFLGIPRSYFVVNFLSCF